MSGCSCSAHDDPGVETPAKPAERLIAKSKHGIQNIAVVFVHKCLHIGRKHWKETAFFNILVVFVHPK